MATQLFRKQGEQFSDSYGNPLAGGKLRYDRAGTSTLLTTYSDAAGTTPNTQTDNRIILDAAGRLEEPVYIDDSFDVKETLFTSADVIVDPWPFDHIPKAVDLAASLSDFAKPRVEWATPDTAATVNLAVSDMGGGRLGDTSSNSITYNLPSASAVGNGRSIRIKKASPANAITVDADGTETVDGGLVFTWRGNNIAYDFVTDGANWRVGSASQATWPEPQGYLTLVSGTPVITSDQVAATTVYYTPDKGNLLPLYDGVRAFSEMSLALASQHTASAIFDIFGFSDDGTLRIGTGPAWATPTAGSGARGTGAGTTELTRVNGLLVNTVSMTTRNGANTYTVAANRGTYLGSIFMDGTNGQVTCHRSFGQSRKWGLWNAYNRRPIILQAGDSTASWTYTTATLRPANNATANSITVFTGLAEELFDLHYQSSASSSDNNNAFINGIGWNSTSAASGVTGKVGGVHATTKDTATARYVNAPALGINVATALEADVFATDTTTWYGGIDNMLLTARWMG